MEIGIDCIDIARFNESSILLKQNLKRIFTNKEIDYCQKMEHPSQHFAVRYAGKEAVQKAFTEYNIAISLNHIEILKKENGKPFVHMVDDKAKDFNIKISLSHSKTTAVAIALITSK